MKLKVCNNGKLLSHFLISIIFESFVIQPAASFTVSHRNTKGHAEPESLVIKSQQERVKRVDSPRERMLHFDLEFKDELTEMQELDHPEAFPGSKNQKTAQVPIPMNQNLLLPKSSVEILQEKIKKITIDSTKNPIAAKPKNSDIPMASGSTPIGAPYHLDSYVVETKSSLDIDRSENEKENSIRPSRNPVNSLPSTPEIDFTPLKKPMEIVHPKGIAGVSKTKDWKKTQFSEIHTSTRPNSSGPPQVKGNNSQASMGMGLKNLVHFVPALNSRPSGLLYSNTVLQNPKANSLGKGTYDSPFVAVVGVFLVSILTLAAWMSQDEPNYNTAFTRIIDPIQDSWDRSFRGRLEFRNPQIYLPHQKVWGYRAPQVQRHWN